MIRLITTATLLMSSAALAQPSQLAFEVASVKVHNGDRRRIFDFSSSGSRVKWLAYPISGLIAEAYNLKNYQLSFLASVRPDNDADYDILAKAEGDGVRSRSDFRVMLQTLLAERFKLQVHRETKEMPVYALVVAKNGPRFKESAPDADAAYLGTVNGRNQGITASRLTMERLADGLGIFVDSNRPVVNSTGLTGIYDIKFEATPAFRMNNDPKLNDISIFVALEEQLGLRLQPQKAQVEVLVVDHVEKPTGN